MLTDMQRAVLTAVHQRPRHAYEVQKEVGSRSVYSVVLSLQVKGLLDAELDVSGNRPRKVLTITAAGKKALR